MKSKKIRSNIITFGLVIVFYAVMEAMLVTGNMSSLMKGLLVPLCYYMILAASLNLVVGISGELSLGHAGFMCIGAFSSAVFARMVGDSIPGGAELFISVLIGAAFAAIFGFLIGIPVLRLRGDYLAIVTLGFGEIIKALANNIYLTMDKNGLHFSFAAAVADADKETSKVILEGAKGIKAPQDTNLVLVVIVLMICMVILMNFINSRAGRACMAVRDNYIAAQSVGINVTKFRLMAFTLSAAIAGVAGVLYSHSLTMLAPKKFDYNLSILILVFVVLGGLGSLRGSVIATIILYALPEIFRELGDYRMLIYAIVLILMMIFNNAPAFIALRERIGISAPVQKIKGIFTRRKNTAGGADNG